MEVFGLLLAIPSCLVACILAANYLSGLADAGVRRLVPYAILLTLLACADWLITARYGECGAYAALGGAYLWMSGLTTFCAPPALLTLVLAAGRHLSLPRRMLLITAVLAAFLAGVAGLARNFDAAEELYGIDGEGGCVQSA